MSHILCITSEHAPHVTSAQLDSDSYQIEIYSCCLFLIVEHRRDFTGELTYGRTHGVMIQQYHPDNGRFPDNAFLNDARTQMQRVTYCGINAYHQNGRVEKRIRDLQDHARVLIMHVTNELLDAITPHLWPYAIQLSNEVRNHSSSNQSGLIPLAGFSRTSRDPDITHLQTFGCPAYVLMPELQAKRKLKGTKVQGGSLPWAITWTLKFSAPYTIIVDRISLTTIPC